MALNYSKGIGGGRFAFVGGFKVVELLVGLWLVERCVDRLPVATVGAFGSEAEALEAAQ
jgi:hypothetical protein